jgi:hypothetical protein
MPDLSNNFYCSFNFFLLISLFLISSSFYFFSFLLISTLIFNLFTNYLHLTTHIIHITFLFECFFAFSLLISLYFEYANEFALYFNSYYVK